MPQPPFPALVTNSEESEEVKPDDLRAIEEITCWNCDEPWNHIAHVMFVRFVKNDGLVWWHIERCARYL